MHRKLNGPVGRNRKLPTYAFIVSGIGGGAVHCRITSSFTGSRGIGSLGTVDRICGPEVKKSDKSGKGRLCDKFKSLARSVTVAVGDGGIDSDESVTAV